MSRGQQRRTSIAGVVLLSACFAIFASVSTASAHGGSVGISGTQWNSNGLVVLLLLGGARWYHAGLSSIRAHQRNGLLPNRRTEYVGYLGLAAIAAAALPPIDTFAEVSVSAHMVQHMLLAFVAPLLLVLGRFETATLATFRQLPLRRIAKMLGGRANGVCHVWGPVGAWCLFASVFWTWHAPTFYEAALRHEPIHALEHASLFVVGFLWCRVLIRFSGRSDFAYGKSIFWLFTTALHVSALTALMAFSSRPWYAPYALGSDRWPINPIVDQQLAGVVAWACMMPFFLGAMAWLFARWFAVEERRAALEIPRRL